jgi:hypothetical protein
MEMMRTVFPIPEAILWNRFDRRSASLGCSPTTREQPRGPALALRARSQESVVARDGNGDRYDQAAALGVERHDRATMESNGSLRDGESDTRTPAAPVARLGDPEERLGNFLEIPLRDTGPAISHVRASNGAPLDQGALQMDLDGALARSESDRVAQKRDRRDPSSSSSSMSNTGNSVTVEPSMFVDHTARVQLDRSRSLKLEAAAALQNFAFA